MNLDRFTIEVRPTAGVHDITSENIPETDPVIVHGCGAEGAARFQAIAGNLAYGSAVVLHGLTDAEFSGVEKQAALQEFRSWHRGPDFPGLPAGARTWVKAVDGNDHYATHLAILVESAKRTTGPVLELGCGRASTPALHVICKEQGRLLVSIDNDAEWLKGFERLSSPGHYLERLADPAQTSWLNNTKWGMVFVDHAPGETRAHAIERAREWAEYIVVHDTETLGYGLEDLLSSFKHRKDFRRARPWTTVVSTTREIW